MSFQNLLFLILFLGFVAMLTVFWLFRKSIDRSRKQFLNRSDDLKRADYSIFRENRDWLDQQDPTLVEIEALDNTKLSGYYLPHENPRMGVILVHGYSSSAQGMASYARYYREHQAASVLMIDLRAHGLSEGKKIGFGYTDRLDLPLWVSQFKMHLPAHLPIVMHGVSMGASSTLYALKDGLDVQAVISDSAYIDLIPVFRRQIQMLYKLPTRGLLAFVSLLMKLSNGFFLYQARLLDQFSADLPLLILHGELDRFVPVDMAHELYRAYLGPKTLYIAPNALHAMTYAVDRPRYEKTLDTFLSSHLKK